MVAGVLPFGTITQPEPLQQESSVAGLSQPAPFRATLKRGWIGLWLTTNGWSLGFRHDNSNLVPQPSMQALIVVLRLLHIVSGALWVGAVVFTAFFLMPTIAAAGPGGGAVMREFGKRKIPQFMMSLMGITVLSGLGLMGVIASRSDGTWFSSPMGRVISLGAAIAIIASVYGAVVNRPVGMRMQQIAAEIQGQPSPAQAAEMQTLQAKMAGAARTVAVMLLLAVAAMAVARYV